jgi:hypothetical protein
MSKSIYGKMKIYNLIALCSLDVNVAKKSTLNEKYFIIQETVSQLSNVLLRKQ